jgi:diguanylate cyclase (GGDEF)-like protein/PAS domain S-box-containing protein
MKEFRRNRRSSFGSFIVDGKGTILGFDQALEELTGWPATDVVGRHKELGLSSLRPDPIQASPLYDGAIAMEAHPRGLQLAMNCRDGRRLGVEALGQPLNGPGERMLVTVLRVMTRSATGVGAPETVGRDGLTGLLDRDAFASRLDADFSNAQTAARPLSIIALDVDHLRKINDRYGREAGDDVLRKLSGILRVVVEDEQRIARLGDDEFGVILERSGRGEARQIAASLRSQVERFPFLASDRPASEPQVTLSLGAASFPADADTQQELVERAYDALDEARTMGRNRVWCYLRRPRVPLQVPVYFDGTDSMLLGYMRDLSPSGIFLQTTAGIDVGMRCALTFPLPGHDGRVHVVGRVVRTVPPQVSDDFGEVRIPGVGVEFERFGDAADRRAIDSFLHTREDWSLRPETGLLSVDS